MKSHRFLSSLILFTVLLSIPFLFCRCQSENLHESIDLPQSFDARTVFSFPAVRNQGKDGTCWAFASIAALEVGMIRNHLSDADIDLSEQQLINAAYGKAHDKAGLLSGSQTVCNGDMQSTGGCETLAAYTLNRWNGPVSEQTVPYGVTDETGEMPEEYYYGKNEAIVSQYYTIPIERQEDIKRMLMQYGIGTLSYYHKPKNYREKTASYYTADAHSSNHEVNVIGWDDTYAVENFRSGQRPENPGAWLIRNSRGENFGQNGTFWLSYEDKSIEPSVTFSEVVSADTYDINYQYDAANMPGETIGCVAVCNLFTARQDEFLKAVNLSVLQNTKARYRIEIYQDPKDLSTLLTMEKPIYRKDFTSEYAGIFTHDLKKTVKLKKDERFAVVMYLLSAEEKELFYDTAKYYNKASFVTCYEAVQNGSWYYVRDGETIKGYPYTKGNFRLKAFTVVKKS